MARALPFSPGRLRSEPRTGLHASIKQSAHDLCMSGCMHASNGRRMPAACRSGCMHGSSAAMPSRVPSRSRSQVLFPFLSLSCAPRAISILGKFWQTPVFPRLTQAEISFPRFTPAFSLLNCAPATRSPLGAPPSFPPASPACVSALSNDVESVEIGPGSPWERLTSSRVHPPRSTRSPSCKARIQP